MTFPLRGEVYWVDLDPTVGTEIAKRRPALIISNDTGNEYSPRVIVAPITSSGTQHVYPFEVLVPAGEAGLRTVSKVLMSQIRVADKQRLGPRLGSLTSQRMEEVTRAIRLTLDV